MADISWIERAYTNFIYRDLCHVFSGGLLICVFEYILWGEIFLPKDFSLESIAFILFSYFIGLGIVSRNDFIIFFVKDVFDLDYTKKKYSNEFLLLQEIMDKYDTRIVNELERLSFLTLIGRTVGISSLISGIFMTVIGLIQTILNVKYITVEYSAIAILLLLSGIIIVYNYFYWVNEYIKNMNDFSKKINEKNMDSFERLLSINPDAPDRTKCRPGS